MSNKTIFYIALPALAFGLIVVHKFVIVRLPIQRRIGWRISVAGFSMAIIGGIVASFLDAVNLGANIAWFGTITAIVGGVVFFNCDSPNE